MEETSFTTFLDLAGQGDFDLEDPEAYCEPAECDDPDAKVA